jgi:tetratricopeptide (TPR) repeat protein
MLEVVKGFSEIETKVTAKQTLDRLLKQRAQTIWSRRWIIGYAAVATMVGLLFLMFWQQTENTLANERVERVVERTSLVSDAVMAREIRDLAITEKKAAEDTMEREYDLGIARLKASRLVGDKLFDWAMKKGYRSLPALDDRELRLQQLETYYEEFLAKNAGMEELTEEMARTRLQLAEISLAAGEAEKAESRLELALAEWNPAENDSEMQLRLGRDRLLLALLKQERGAENLGEVFQQAREALEAVGDTQDLRLRQLLAILDFNEAKLLASEEQDAKALEQLLRATRILNELADLRPDAAVLRSELAECYLSSARILEGMGNLGDAREVRALAAKEMEKLLSEDPGNSELQLELAGAYGAMAEASLLSGDIESVKSLSADAMKLLNEVLQKQPESRIAKIRKAAQMGLQAGLLRDQGKPEEALAMFEQGIAMLEREKSGPMVDYRLALLRWQKGRMLGFSGEKEQELTLLSQANESLRKLQDGDDAMGLWRDALPRSRAYLLGDYAHALELAKDKKKSKEIYREAAGLWEKLLDSRPESEEYRSALEWTLERSKGV